MPQKIKIKAKVNEILAAKAKFIDFFCLLLYNAKYNNFY